MAAAAVPIVHASPATLLVMVSAPLTGLLALFVRMIGRSGRPKMATEVLAQAPAEVLTIGIFDVLGGIICAGGVVIFGITRPPALVSGFDSSPVLAWLGVGALGPLVSAGVLDRLPLRTVADHTNRGSQQALGSVFSELRFQATQRVLERLYEEVEFAEGVQRDGYATQARSLIDAGLLEFDDIHLQVERFGSEPEVVLPKPVKKLLAARTSWPVDVDPGREAVVLVDTCLKVDVVAPVAVACRIARQRSGGGQDG